MGSFGFQSHANDTTWDLLGQGYDEDVHGNEVFPNTQARANVVLDYIARDFPGDSQRYYAKGDPTQTVLGPVVWMLEEGFTVPLIMKQRALAVARAAVKDKAYLECWPATQDRVDALTGEIVLLRKAVKEALS